MWMFYADNTGYIPMGNDGQMKVPSNIRNHRQLEKLAASWLGKRRGRVYLMASWTQQMSELGPRAFEEYIMRTAEVIKYN